MILKGLFRHRLAFVSGLVLLLFIILALIAPWLALMVGYDNESVDLFNRFSPSSSQHFLGTDELGRDFLFRLLLGGRISLLVGLCAALTSACLGTVIGVIAGYFGGRMDAFLMRFTDAIISLPLLPLLIILAAIDPVKLGLADSVLSSDNVSLYRIILIVTLFGWTTVARLVRGATLSLRERDFIMAAKAQGASSSRIIRVHILPGLASPIIVATTLSAGNIILLESVLSFLGLGIQPPVPSWGNLLTNAQELIWEAPALAFFPGAMILLTVICFNFLGDGLQDALDPRSHRRNQNT